MISPMRFAARSTPARRFASRATNSARGASRSRRPSRQPPPLDTERIVVRGTPRQETASGRVIAMAEPPSDGTGQYEQIPGLTRRRLLAGAGAAGIIAACQPTGAGPAPSATAALATAAPSATQAAAATSKDMKQVG